MKETPIDPRALPSDWLNVPNPTGPAIPRNTLSAKARSTAEAAEQGNEKTKAASELAAKRAALAEFNRTRPRAAIVSFGAGSMVVKNLRVENADGAVALGGRIGEATVEATTKDVRAPLHIDKSANIGSLDFDMKAMKGQKPKNR